MIAAGGVSGARIPGLRIGARSVWAGLSTPGSATKKPGRIIRPGLNDSPALALLIAPEQRRYTSKPTGRQERQQQPDTGRAAATAARSVVEDRLLQGVRSHDLDLQAVRETVVIGVVVEWIRAGFDFLAVTEVIV